MVSTPARQPKMPPTTGAMAATSMAPAGTPHCFSPKIRLRRCGGTRGASRWLPAGVMGPCATPARMAENTSAQGLPSTASGSPAAMPTSAAWHTRTPPCRTSNPWLSGPESRAPR